MKYGYTRVSTKGQLDGNNIEEQTNASTLFAEKEGFRLGIIYAV